MIEASCHCGNVKISIPNFPDTVTNCNCSVCRRYSALWAYFNPKSVSVNSHADDIGSYSWGDKTIEFHNCKNCGCLTHYTPTEQGNVNKMAVNFRLFPSDRVNCVKVRYFDGADRWEYIGE
jgi:hypothetical protein